MNIVSKTKKSPLYLNWGDIYDGYGSKNLAYHISQTGKRDLLQQLLSLAQWDVLIFWDIKSLDQYDYKSLYSKIDFVLSQSMGVLPSENEDKQLEASIHLAKGILSAIQGDHNKSQSSLELAYDKFKEIDNYNLLFEIMLLLAGISFQVGKLNESDHYLEYAIQRAKKDNDRYKLTLGYYTYGELSMIRGNISRANSLFSDALAMLSDTPADLRTARLYLNLSKATRVATKQLASSKRQRNEIKNLTKAKSYLKKGLALAFKSGRNDLLAQFYLELTKLHLLESEYLEVGKDRLKALEEGVQFANEARAISRGGYYYMSAIFNLALCYYSCEKYQDAKRLINYTLKPVLVRDQLKMLLMNQGSITIETDWGSVTRLYLLRGSILINEFIGTKNKSLVKKAAKDFFVVFRLLRLLRNSYNIFDESLKILHGKLVLLNYNELMQFIFSLNEFEKKYQLRIDVRSDAWVQNMFDNLRFSAMLRESPEKHSLMSRLKFVSDDLNPI